MKTAKRKIGARHALLFGSIFALLSISSNACDRKDATPRGELMLVITTDMSPPKDFDTIHIEVTQSSVPYHRLDYFYDVPPTFRLPATLAVIAGSDTAIPVDIRVIARRGGASGVPVVLRDARTTVPTDRIAELRIGLSYLCAGKVSDTGGDVESTCPKGKSGEAQTCVDGACVDVTVDVTTLPTFEPPNVFGGGHGTGDGACFDTLACFTKSAPATGLASADCSIDAPSTSIGSGVFVGLNVGLLGPPKSEGICADSGCIVPLDHDDTTGFSIAGARIKLPKAACDSGRTIVVSTSCSSKTTSLPTCGPWSSSGEDAGTDATLPGFDAGPADSGDGGDSGAGSDARDAPSDGPDTSLDASIDALRDTLSDTFDAPPPAATPWAKSYGGTRSDIGRSLALRAGRLAIAGSYGTTGLSLGDGKTLPTVTTAQTGIYLLDVDASNGNTHWSKGFAGDDKLPLGGDDDRAQMHVARDATGNVFLAGTFHGTVDFGKGVLTNSATDAQQGDLFFLKASVTDGSTLWSRQVGGPGNDVPTAIVDDGADGVAIGGWFNKTVDFGGGTSFNGLGGYNCFVTRLKTDGSPSWTVAFLADATSNSGARALARGPLDTFYLAGNYQNNVQFQGGVVHSADSDGSPDSFILQLDGKTGAVQKQTFFTGKLWDHVEAIAVDSKGDVAVAGWFQQAITIGSKVLTSDASVTTGKDDIFVAKLSGADLSTLWAVRAGGPDDDQAFGIDFSPAGDVLVTGYLKGLADVGLGTKLPAKGVQDLFVARLAGATGATISASRFGDTSGSGFAYASRLVADGSVGAFVVGVLSKSLDVPPLTLTNPSGGPATQLMFGAIALP